MMMIKMIISKHSWGRVQKGYNVKYIVHVIDITWYHLRTCFFIKLATGSSLECYYSDLLQQTVYHRPGKSSEEDHHLSTNVFHSLLTTTVCYGRRFNYYMLMDTDMYASLWWPVTDSGSSQFILELIMDTDFGESLFVTNVIDLCYYFISTINRRGENPIVMMVNLKSWIQMTISCNDTYSGFKLDWCL